MRVNYVSHLIRSSMCRACPWVVTDTVTKQQVARLIFLAPSDMFWVECEIKEAQAAAFDDEFWNRNTLEYRCECCSYRTMQVISRFAPQSRTLLVRFMYVLDSELSMLEKAMLNAYEWVPFADQLLAWTDPPMGAGRVQSDRVSRR